MNVEVMNMKKFTEKFAALIIMSAFLLCLTGSANVGQAVYEAIRRCLETIIPSLYAVMIMSQVIIRSGTASLIPEWIRRISERIFGMEGFVLPIFAFSMFAGYPVGAKMLAGEYDKGRLTQNRAEILCGLCYGAGPAFIFGCISGKLYSSEQVGLLIVISAVSANIILALFMSFFLRKSVKNDEIRGKFSFSADMLTECVISGGRSVLEICFMVTAFAVISEFFRASGAADMAGGLLSKLIGTDKETAVALCCAFLDVTDISGLPCGDYTILPYVCGLVSFGGICVIFQVSAAVSERFSVIPLIFERLAAALISGTICRSLLPYYIAYNVTAVSNVQIHAYNGYSPIPSLMIVIMTLWLFGEYCQKVNKL